MLESIYIYTIYIYMCVFETTSYEIKKKQE